jgi:hypothetical protein
MYFIVCLYLCVLQLCSYAVLCILVWLVPRVKSFGTIFIWRCSWFT